MSADNHTVSTVGDAARFTVRPNSVAIFYTFEVIFCAAATMFLATFLLHGGTTSVEALTSEMYFGLALGVGIVFLMPSRRYRTRFSFFVDRQAVHIESKLGAMTTVPLETIREIVLRNTVIGKWHHDIALNQLGPSGTVYGGIGLGGIAIAQGMALADSAAASSRNFLYGISAGARAKRSFYVALRTGKNEVVVGGGLTEQSAADLASDVAKAIAQYRQRG